MSFSHLRFTISNNREGDVTNLTEFTLVDSDNNLPNMASMIDASLSTPEPVADKPLNNLFDGTLSYTSWSGHNIVVNIDFNTVLNITDYPKYALYINNGGLGSSYDVCTNPSEFTVELSPNGTTWSQYSNKTILMEAGSNGAYIYFTWNPPVCVHPDTMIAMSNGTTLPIKLLKRGDVIMTDCSQTGVISKIIKTRCDKCIQIPKNSLIGNNADLIISDTHPVWIPSESQTDVGRIYAWNVPGAIALEESHTLYNIQMDMENTYLANGAKIDSMSPYNQFYPLDKNDFIDCASYIDNYVITRENDTRRKKPLLKIAGGTDGVFTPKECTIDYVGMFVHLSTSPASRSI